ncbi:MAG TPA: isoprenylcysteine carboxylmethyltransferase family protein [Candidatus Polarisedimenticolia bacterium]|jgi:protein-S-isoprenylcysteine O-methyltransferase Ste14|nr:isoprenylcysteine carboxylmethyltransferase family protein [Candidatus Polarisedimenticolia bacterium]
MKRLMVAAGNFFFHWREMLFPLVQVLLVFGFAPRPWPGGASGSGLDVGDALGLLLLFLGQGLRMAVIGFAYIKRGGQNRRIHADDLVTDGLFAHCRNPLYVGNVLILSGLFLVHGNPWVVGLGIGFFVFAYIAITLAEEAFLAGRFGAAYEDYLRRVPRFLPNPRGLGRTLQGMTFDWAKVVRKEYGATFAWVTMLVLILTLESRQRLDADAFKARVLLLAGVWGVALLGYVTARALKKRGSLGGHTRRAES